MDHINKMNKRDGDDTRLPYLDLYKGVCILFIVFTHYKWSTQQRNMLLFPFWIDMAVPVFMVITGFLNSYSLDRIGDDRYKEYYRIRNIACKGMRFMIPIAMIAIVRAFCCQKANPSVNPLKLMASIFLTGGMGPGAYYFPVMLQIIIFFPIIHYLIDSYKEKGLAAAFGLNLLFELIKSFFKMNPEIYRLCSFRYIFIVAFGSYTYYFWHKEYTHKKLLFILGF